MIFDNQVQKDTLKKMIELGTWNGVGIMDMRSAVIVYDEVSNGEVKKEDNNA